MFCYCLTFSEWSLRLMSDMHGSVCVLNIQYHIHTTRSLPPLIYSLRGILYITPHIHIHTHTPIHAYTHTYTHKHIHTHTYCTYIHTHIHVYIHTCMHKYTCHLSVICKLFRDCNNSDEAYMRRGRSCLAEATPPPHTHTHPT